jgi:predicted hotdog family 3-hydroxylacyl-ACP dehydratase
MSSTVKVDEFTVEEVVPHAGVMSLLDRVLDCGEDWLEAEVVINRGSLFAEERSEHQQGVPAWAGIEYMAQAIAAFAGVQRRRRGLEAVVGFLVGTRRYDSSRSHFPFGSRLRVRVEREFQADNGLGVFACEISGETAEGAEFTASAALNVFQPDNVEEFLDQAG